MTTAAFYEDGTRLLTPEAFEFMLAAELKRAIRAQTFLTLVTIEVRRVWDGLTVVADDATVTEVGGLVAREVRATDPIARAGRGLLGLMLLDADAAGGASVIGRVMTRVDGYRFPAPVAISIGAACCPTHAVDAESLKREAFSRPMVSARRGVHPVSAADVP
jgi:diguanylate cyclase (GGDEF)-like protein